MGFSGLSLKNEYRTFVDNIVLDFYIPLLRYSVLYQRAVGFFSSSALVDISYGITGLIENNGKIELVASPHLQEDDIEAIQMGYEEREKIIKHALIRNLVEPKDSIEKDRLNLVAYLISQGILDIKIAFTKNNDSIGMYHEKMGVFTDGNCNFVSFSGSLNESSNAFSNNYEVIDVFCSWEDEKELKRAVNKKQAFEKIWNNCETDISVVKFPELSVEILKRYKFSSPNFAIDNQFLLDPINIKHPKIPEKVTLYDYQKKAIDKWKHNNYCGIFDMATGTGKTITGISGIVELSKNLNYSLAVVIVCPFQHLVEQWIEDLVLFQIQPIVGYSASSQKDWKKRLSNSIRDQKIGVNNKKFFCFICTNATYSSQFVQSELKKIKGNALLLVDEAHNFGADRLNSLLIDKFTYRLALSATIERFNDQEGTEKLLNYFGEKCIVYSLEEAISNKKLTPYKYYPIVVTLTDKERVEYVNISKEIGGCMIKDKNGKYKLNEKGKRLAIKRARIVASAQNKIECLRTKILPYKNEKHILVYCGAASQYWDDESDLDFEDDMRQIDVVTNLLGNELCMKVAQFTSKEDINTRNRLKIEFEEGNELQALIAIKCLDEGVNIPKIKVAFILASTTNPKEYIQRRGRVLRLAKNKHFAEIYDFITLLHPIEDVPNLTDEQKKYDKSLARREIIRAEEFANISMNSFQVNNLIINLKKTFNLFDNGTTIDDFE